MTASLQLLAGLQSDIVWAAVRLVTEESGQDMIEYALIAATVGLGTVAGVNGLAASISNYMNIVATAYENAVKGI